MITSNQKPKPGRPATGIGEQIQVRLKPSQLSALDAWIADQIHADLTRPEAVRWLLEQALAKYAKGELISYHEDAMSKIVKTDALNFLKAAQGHLDAAVIIEKNVGHIDPNSNTNSALFAPLYNVLGFAIELSLKAHLALKGLTSAELKDKYGHNLKKLWARTVKDGPVIHQEAMDIIIEKMAPNHGGYDYRYLKDGVPMNYFHSGDSINTVFRAIREFNNVTMQALNN